MKQLILHHHYLQQHYRQYHLPPRRHPHRRALEEPPALWREGASRLLDYGGRGRPVLFVPSLVNRAHVLDLDEGASLLRFLRANGVRPLLLDWGWPAEAERRFTLTDHIAGRMERALQAAPRNLILAGYCMGGLLALAAGLRQPERVRALALLATPWDFHADPQAAGLARLLPGLEPVMEPLGALPVDALQGLFAMLDPYSVGEKFRAFARLDRLVAHLGEVGGRDHRLHAGQRARGRGVDAQDARMRVRAALDQAGEHAGQTQVGAEIGAAGDLVGAVGTVGTRADDLELASAHRAVSLISAATSMTARTILS